MNNQTTFQTLGSDHPMTACSKVEIRVRIPSNKGRPADALALLADHHLPTLTHGYLADREGLLLLLTTTRTEEVRQVLEAAGYDCQMHTVVLLGPATYRPGVAARLLAKLEHAGVDIRCSYLSSSAPDRFYLIVETTHENRTLKLMTAAA